MISLRRLGCARRAALRVLYLAPHAPAPGAAPPPAVHPEFGVQAAYQYEIWDLLCNGLGLDVESRSDLAVLPQAFDGRNYVFTIYNIAPFRNSEVYVSALAAAAGIACLGAPPNVRALIEDKWLTKLTAQALGLPTPPGTVFSPGVPVRAPAFDGPYIAKPRFGAASMGIDSHSAHADFDVLAARVAALETSTDECLVEQVIGDCDVTVPILIGDDGPVALPPARQTIDSAYGIFTHCHKRRLIPGLTRDFPDNEPVACANRRRCAPFRAGDDAIRLYPLRLPLRSDWPRSAGMQSRLLDWQRDGLRTVRRNGRNSARRAR